MEPIFLADDFSALLKLPLISTQEQLWIDLWQQQHLSPLDGQYLSSLKSFVGLRCLRVTGMLTSYQKQLFQAIWKMEQLEDLQLRMAEEPRLEAGVVQWRRIEEGWQPGVLDAHAYVSPYVSSSPFYFFFSTFPCILSVDVCITEATAKAASNPNTAPANT